MDKTNENKLPAPSVSYREIKIGNTLYRVTSIFKGEKDLRKTLEALAVRCALTESQATSA